MPNDAVDCSRERITNIREALQQWYAAVANDHASLAIDLHEAADALEALLARTEEAWEGSRSAAVATAKAHVELVQVIAQRDAAVAEAGRLREALRKIAGISNECTWHAHTRKLAAEMQDIIRAALASGERA